MGLFKKVVDRRFAQLARGEGKFLTPRRRDNHLRRGPWAAGFLIRFKFISIFLRDIRTWRSRLARIVRHCAAIAPPQFQFRPYKAVKMVEFWRRLGTWTLSRF